MPSQLALRALLYLDVYMLKFIYDIHNIQRRMSIYYE